MAKKSRRQTNSSNLMLNETVIHMKECGMHAIMHRNVNQNAYIARRQFRINSSAEFQILRGRKREHACTRARTHNKRRMWLFTSKPKINEIFIELDLLLSMAISICVRCVLASHFHFKTEIICLCGILRIQVIPYHISIFWMSWLKNKNKNKKIQNKEQNRVRDCSRQKNRAHELASSRMSLYFCYLSQTECVCVCVCWYKLSNSIKSIKCVWAYAHARVQLRTCLSHCAHRKLIKFILQHDSC